MAHPNVELLRRAYDAFDKGDMDTLRELFQPDIIGHVPGRSQVAGDYKGVDEVLMLFGKLNELSGESFNAEVHAILADDEHGAVLGTQTGQRDGKTLTSSTIEVFHFQGGKISEFWALAVDQYAEDEFWG